MWYRRLIALLALVNAFVALYLHLWKQGLAGSLSCGAGGGCMIAQMSSYGWFMGVDVALIGVVGYTLILIVAVSGSLVQSADAPWPTSLLVGLIGPALAFTVRLKYGEFIVLRTFCPWCAISAVSITLCGILVLLDWRRVHRGAPRSPNVGVVT
jgi:uncharacterized membrane protein